jgi:hypothetical protein
MCPATCEVCDPVVSIPDRPVTPIPIDADDLDLAALPEPPTGGKKRKHDDGGLSLTIVLVLVAAAAVVLCCVSAAAYYARHARGSELGKPAEPAPPSWSRASFVEESEQAAAPSSVVVLDL